MNLADELERDKAYYAGYNKEWLGLDVGFDAKNNLQRKAYEMGREDARGDRDREITTGGSDPHRW